jgi:hypothetical protein
MGREKAGWPEYLLVLLAPVLSLALILNPFPISSSHENVTDEQLASRYAPILVFDPGEQLRPMDPGPFVNTSQVYFMANTNAILVDDGPYLAHMTSYPGPFYYLDNTAGGLDDDGVIGQFTYNGTGPVVSYVHISHQADSILLQYWFFYAFNYGPVNRHEGDWEMFQVVLDLQQRPLWAMVSQHHSGARMAWDQLTTEDGHVRVYVELGSHSNHLLPIAGNNMTFPAEDLTLVQMNVTATPWIVFAGRWGEWGGTLGDILGRRGPEGPMYREGGQMWDGVAWGMALPLEDA